MSSARSSAHKNQNVLRRTSAGTLTETHVGQRVLLQGWVNKRRDLGGILFLELRDRSGIVQLMVHPGNQPAAAETLDKARNEWVISVEGEVVKRDPKTVNERLATGQIEIVVDQAEILSRSQPLPFNVEDKVEASEETRLKYRFLDLRREGLRDAMMLRSEVTIATLEHLRSEGFINVETPILTRSTPEGARDYLVPSRVHQGQFYALPQSPQIFKQILMVSGFERYVQIARCFRDEDLRADRQPEFTQIDCELSFIDEEDIYSLTEGLFGHLFPKVGIHPPETFPRLTYQDAMTRYGSDRPDLRTDLEIYDLTDLWQDSSFRVFEKTVAEGGVIRALPIPGAAGASRKQVDGYNELARRHGVAGVIALRRQGGELKFQVKDVLSEGQLERAAERLKLGEGDLALVVAAAPTLASEALGGLRVPLAREYGLLREDAHEFLWVHDFPLVLWDADSQRWGATHHPFTSPQMQDLDKLESDPAKVRSRAYDVVLNGLELGGGSIRIHDAELQQRVFQLLEISPEEAEERFGFLLEALRYGAPPHGGIAFGLDRLVMLMAWARFAARRDCVSQDGLCGLSDDGGTIPGGSGAASGTWSPCAAARQGSSPGMKSEPLGTLDLAHPRGVSRIHVARGLTALVPFTESDAMGEVARWLLGRRVFLVSCDPLYRMHAGRLMPLLELASEVVELEVPDGEAAKTVEQAHALWDQMLRAGGKRDSRLITLGGGSVGDLGGFVAGAFLRGIEYTQIPTTLLAQVDASVGGKTGVDLPGGKNTVGLFHHPRFVLVDPEVLFTLPERLLRAGLYEVVKKGVVLDRSLFEQCEELLGGDADLSLEDALRSSDPFDELILGAIRNKLRVVEEDPEEGGLRRLLNFGHTLAHAIETQQEYQGLQHGEAVGWGMRFALMLSEEAELESAAAERVRAVIDRLAPPALEGVCVQGLLDAMSRDKKANEAGIAWVLARKLGEGYTTREVAAEQISAQLERFLANS